MEIFCDRISLTAPVQWNSNVVELVRLTSSLNSLEGTLKEEKGKDGRMYYCLDGHIEAVYRSASTEYTLIVDGRLFIRWKGMPLTQMQENVTTRSLLSMCDQM
jgi:hypothetical protein